jgi:hypothetical protein
MTYVMRGDDPSSPQNFEWTYRENTAAESGDQPRHHHNMDQLHLVFADGGEGPMIPKHVVYISEGVFYQGIRMQFQLQDVPPDQFVGFLVWQGGGSTGIGHVPYDLFGETSGKMADSKKGYFDKGIWHYTDENGKPQQQDGFEAVWQEINKKPVTYPEQRYGDPIAASVARFAYLPSKKERGISLKHIGTWSERRISASFIKWEKGATHRVEGLEAPQLHFVVRGELTTQGHDKIGYHAAMKFYPEEPKDLTALEETETFVVDLPVF